MPLVESLRRGAARYRHRSNRDFFRCCTAAAYISIYQRHPTCYGFRYCNSEVKLLFLLERQREITYLLELFRKAYSAYGAAKSWTQENILTHLIRLWALLHGLTALVISASVEWDGNWQRGLDNIIE